MHPEDYFKIESALSPASLARGAKIHIVGVCGVAMAELACALSREGYAVSGSDTDFWEPMGSRLRASTVTLHNGYNPGNIPDDVELVVIGNAIRADNVEISGVRERNLPYSFFPKLLADIAVEGRHSIVVSGTHGKTTTTALLAYLLESCGRQPSWFFGGAAEQFPESLRVGRGPFSAVEGDEYDSAFFAKVPKFTFYLPDTLVITSIEYDHADIYPDLQSVINEFSKRVVTMPVHGKVIACDETRLMRELISRWRGEWKGEIVTYGTEASDFALKRLEQGRHSQTFEIRDPEGMRYTASTELPGAYNAQNATAAFAACRLCAIPAFEILEAMACFKGVKRRQEEWETGAGVTLIEDFAHHPTAVRRTLEGLRERYPGRRLWAVFEPRSNTSRRKIFQNDYIDALSAADCIALCAVVPRHNDAGLDLLNVREVCRSLISNGKTAVELPDYDSVRDFIISSARPGDVVVMMSNGSFGGIIPEIAAATLFPG